MAIIASFPSLGGGRMVIPDYGGVAGTGPATFLNFPMTISDKKPTADGAREGAIWVQTKNLLGDATKILFSDTIPGADSEDNVLYFVFPSLKSIKMDVVQNTGVWKPIEVHIAIGPDYPWLVGSLEDGSKMWLALPQMYSKISGKVNIENAWYWHDESWQIISEVGRSFFKETLAVNLIGSGLDISYYQKTLPANEDYFVNCTGEYLVVTKHIIRGSVSGHSALYPDYYSEEASTFQIYRLSGVIEYEAVTDEIHLNSFDGIVPDGCDGPYETIIMNNALIYFYDVACNADASLLAVAFLSKDKGAGLNLENGFAILERGIEGEYLVKNVHYDVTTINSLTIKNVLNRNDLITFVDPSFCLFMFTRIQARENTTTPISNAYPYCCYYNGDDVIFIKNDIYQYIYKVDYGYKLKMLNKVFDEHLILMLLGHSGNMVSHAFILIDEGVILDTYMLSTYVYAGNASYERIGKYGVVTYATTDTGQTGDYIMGLSYDRETLQFVSTNVPVRTADTISNPIDEVFPERQYLSHYSIQKDEALFTINGITLLMGGEAGTNFDTETGVITPATTMMDQGVKVYEDTVSRTDLPNIYI